MIYIYIYIHIIRIYEYIARPLHAKLGIENIVGIVGLPPPAPEPLYEHPYSSADLICKFVEVIFEVLLGPKQIQLKADTPPPDIGPSYSILGGFLSCSRRSPMCCGGKGPKRSQTSAQSG